MIFDTLKEKCLYRGLTDYKLMPSTPIIVMVDGRSFSKKIKPQFEKPFGRKFIKIMNETAKYLCDNVQGCKIGYVQSDEISLLLYDGNRSEPFFGNRLCKLQSIIASMATAKFNSLMMLKMIDGPYNTSEMANLIMEKPLYEFDCKAWNVPTINDAYNWFLYRLYDCIRNSRQMAAQTYLSHSKLNGLTQTSRLNSLRRNTVSIGTRSTMMG